MGLFSKKEKAPFQGALFDFGGTLVESDRWYCHAWRALLARRGLRHQDYDPAWHEGMMGVGYVLPVMERFGIRESAEAFAEEWRQEADALIRSRASLTPGAKRLLKDVRGLGVRTAIVTSFTTATMQYLLDRLKIRGYIGLVITSDWLIENHLRGKPAPDPYVAASHHLGVPAGRCIAFEDTPIGIISARMAGCRSVVGVVNRDYGFMDKRSYRKRVLLNASGATLTLPSFEGFRIRECFGSL